MLQARLPIEVLQSYVMRYFTHIHNNNLPPDDFRQYEDIVFKTSEFHKLYYVKPMKDILEVNGNYFIYFIF